LRKSAEIRVWLLSDHHDTILRGAHDFHRVLQRVTARRYGPKNSLLRDDEAAMVVRSS
jgi:hypothetical protein